MAQDPLNPQLGGPQDASGLNPGVERRIDNPIAQVESQERLFKASQKNSDFNKAVQVINALGPLAAQTIGAFKDQSLLEKSAQQNEAIQGQIADINAQEAAAQKDISRAAAIQSRQDAGNDLTEPEQTFLNNFKAEGERLKLAASQRQMTRLELEAKQRSLLNQAISERPHLSQQLQGVFSLRTGSPRTTATTAATTRERNDTLQKAEQMFGPGFTVDNVLTVEAMKQGAARQELTPMTAAKAFQDTAFTASGRYRVIGEKYRTEFRTNGFIDKNRFSSDVLVAKENMLAIYDQKVRDSIARGIPIPQEERDELIKALDRESESLIKWSQGKDFETRITAYNNLQDQMLKTGALGQAGLLSNIVDSMGPAGGNMVASQITAIASGKPDGKTIANLAGVPGQGTVADVAQVYLQAINEVSNRPEIVPPGMEALHAWVTGNVMRTATTPEEVGPEVPVAHISALEQASRDATPQNTSEFFKNLTDTKKSQVYMRDDARSKQAQQKLVGLVDQKELFLKSDLSQRLAQGWDMELTDQGRIIVFNPKSEFGVTSTPELDQELGGALGTPNLELFKSNRTKQRDLELERALNADFEFRKNSDWENLFGITSTEWLGGLVDFVQQTKKSVQEQQQEQELTEGLPGF